MIRKVVHFIDSTEFGGTEKCLLNLLVGLDQQEWLPVLVHHAEPGLKPLLKEASKLGVSLHPVPVARPARALTMMFGLFRVLLEERPTVFHAHLNWQGACGYGLLAAAALRIPAVVATNHSFVEVPLSRVGRLKSRVIDACMDRYIAVSRGVAKSLCDALGVKDRKLSVVPNGVPLDDYHSRPDPQLHAEMMGRSCKHIVLTSARFVEGKGHRYLIEAAAQVPEAVFVLAGDGPTRSEIEALASSLGVTDRVRFLGHREDIIELLSICDVFVLPSMFEGLPLTVLEAMAAGKPVIATAISGTDESIVHGESGLLVPPRNASALAVAIRTVLNDPFLAGKLAASGQERVREKFSVQNMVEGVVGIYEEVLTSGG